jgi:hypothetical protein
MMVSVSVWFVLACALMVSSALAWLNRRSASALASAAATLAVSLGFAAFQFMAYRSAPLPPRLFTLWILWVLAPSAAVFAVSRLLAFRARPWLLMLAGPVSFLVGLIVAMTVYGVFVGSGRPK